MVLSGTTNGLLTKLSIVEPSREDGQEAVLGTCLRPAPPCPASDGGFQSCHWDLTYLETAACEPLQLTPCWGMNGRKLIPTYPERMEITT
jgi:hypothetical protein